MLRFESGVTHHFCGIEIFNPHRVDHSSSPTSSSRRAPRASRSVLVTPSSLQFDSGPNVLPGSSVLSAEARRLRASSLIARYRFAFSRPQHRPVRCSHYAMLTAGSGTRSSSALMHNACGRPRYISPPYIQRMLCCIILLCNSLTLAA
jgi:hypothetical protein